MPIMTTSHVEYLAHHWIVLAVACAGTVTGAANRSGRSAELTSSGEMSSISVASSSGIGPARPQAR